MKKTWDAILLMGAFQLLAGHVGALAQESSRPIWSEGDTWTYRHVERMSGNAETVRTYRVVEKRPDRYRVAYTRSDRADPIENLYSIDINRLVEDAGKSLIERKTYQWPLIAGRTWSFEYTENSERFAERVYTFHLRARAETREEVVVPAGKFETIRVRVEGEYFRSNDRRSAPIAYTVWYSDKVKRAVKTQFRRGQFTTMTPWNDSSMELVAYRVQDQ